MQAVRRARFLALPLLPLLLVSGCNFDSGSSTGAGAVIAPAGGTGSTGGAGGSGTGSGNSGFGGGSAGLNGTADAVIATPSVAGTVSVAAGSTQTISVTFTSGDDRPIRGLAISATTLPQDWSGIDHYSCTLVGAGRSCVLNLTYAPQAVESGTLSINYLYIDDANEPKTPGGSLLIPYVATSHDNVLAATSPTGQISAAPGAGTQPVSIHFTTDSGNAASGLTLLTDLAMLPAGWSSSVPSFSCPIVSTGSGCQLVLDYAPTATVSGTLTLSYAYTDDSGAPESGALNIPYSATTDGNIVALVAPAGQVEAIQKTGTQAVAVTFTTDDGKPASNLSLLADLASLPAGWSSRSSHFTCGSVNTGNGCQLALQYAPTDTARGTLSLNYSYFDAGGTYNVGSVDIDYAGTTNDNGVGTAAPSGQVNAIVAMGSPPVAVTFTTDDGRPATALRLTSALATLPPGWSSSLGSFSCSGFSSGSGCQLPLTYAPPAAASGSVTLTYTYLNNAGEAKSGSVSIPYRATTDNNVIATPSQNPLSVIAGSSNPVAVTFTTDDGNLATGLTITSGLSSLPAGWSSTGSSFGCSSVSVGTNCQLALNYSPATSDAGTLTLGFSYTNNSGMAKTGTVAIAYTATP